MAVDLYIGTVAMTIETASGNDTEREQLIALILARLRAEQARDGADLAARQRDSAAITRSFGRRV